MKKSQYKEEQVITTVKQMEAAQKAKELARELGGSEATLYAWKSKYGGMEVNEPKRLRELEQENSRLKKLVADLSLDKDALETVIRENRMELVGQRQEVALIMAEHGSSERQACKLLEVDRTSDRYAPQPDRNAGLRQALVGLARQKPRLGSRRVGAVLAKRGWKANAKRIHRLYRNRRSYTRECPESVSPVAHEQSDSGEKKGSNACAAAMAIGLTRARRTARTIW